MALNCLKRLRKFLDRISPKPDTLSPSVDPSERLSRFILTKRYMKSAQKRVTPQAFMPSNKNGETSVYRTEQCTDAAIWEIGNGYVTALRLDSKPVIGRGDLITQDVIKHSLRVIASPDSHPRHANIVDWPVEKAPRLMLATELALRATLVISPTSTDETTS